MKKMDRRLQHITKNTFTKIIKQMQSNDGSAEYVTVKMWSSNQAGLSNMSV